MQSHHARARNRRTVKSHARLIAALTAAVCCGRGVSRVMADTWTWTGGGSDFNWNDASNWSHTSGSSNSAVPLNAIDTVVDFAGSSNPIVTQNIANPLLLNSVGFNSGATVFTLEGNPLIFENNSGGTAPSIVQNSTSFEEFEQTLTFAVTTTFSGSGTGGLLLFDPIVGSGTLVDNGAAAAIELLNTNTYSGGTKLNGGQIIFNNQDSFGAGTITFIGGTLTAGITTSMDNVFSSSGAGADFQANSGATLTVNPSNASFGDLSFGSSTETGTVNFEPATFTFFGGTINVNGGTLLDGADALSQTLGSYSVAIASSATFNINGFSATIQDLTGAGTLATGSNSSATFTLEAANFSGNITGSGKLFTTGGTVILSGANSYSGGTALNGGTIGAGNGSAFGSAAVAVGGNVDLYATGATEILTNPISIASGKTLTIINDPTTPQSLSLNGNISGSGSLATSGSVNLTLDGTNSYSGGTTLNGGQININNSSSLGNASGTLTLNGGTLAATANVTENNPFTTETATAPVTFEAATGTTLNLDGPDFLGNETLNFGSATDTGTVNFAPNGGFEPGFPIYNVNGGLLFDGFGNLAINLGGDTLTIAQIATVNLNGFSTTLADLTGAGALVTGTSAAETLGLQAANFSGKISGSGHVSIAGGTVILSGANTYSGGTAISSGLIGAGNGSAFGSAAVTVSGSSDLYAAGANESLSNPISIASGQSLTIVDDPTGAHNLGLTGNISGSGALVMSATGNLTLDGTNSYSGGTTINGGQILFNNSKAFGAGTVAFNSGTLTATATTSFPNSFSTTAGTAITFQAATGSTLTVSSPSSGVHSMNFGSSSDAGTVNFSPTTNAFGGQINVNGGTLLDGADVISQILSIYNVSIASSATLNLNGFSPTVQNLTGAGTLATGTNTSETFTLKAANFSGNITGSGQLVVAGGTVTLTGTNTYSGGTTLNSGELVINNNSSLGNTLGELTLNSGTITSTSSLSINHNFSDTESNPVTVQAATGTTLTLGGADTLDTVNVLTFGSSSDAGTVDFTPGAIFNIGGATNGQLNINGGTLLDGDGLLSFAITQLGPTVSIAQSATLNVNGSSVAITDLLGSGTLATGSSSSETLTLNAANFSGNINGSGALVIAGGTAMLSGTNTYSGGTSVTSGELQIGAAAALPNAPVTVANASLIQLESSIGRVTIGSLSLVGSGNVDITNNALFIDYGAGSDPIASIVSYLTTGYAGSQWNGGAIDSSAVASLESSQKNLIYSIGYSDAADGMVGAVPPDEIEILPTLAGDAKLAGTVNFGDFQILSQYFGNAGGWDEGNFTYGATVNFGDFQLLAQDFGSTSSGLSASEMASLNSFAAQFGDALVANAGGGFSLVAVPEPASIGLLAAAGMGLLARRRRNKPSLERVVHFKPLRSS